MSGCGCRLTIDDQRAVAASTERSGTCRFCHVWRAPERSDRYKTGPFSIAPKSCVLIFRRPILVQAPGHGEAQFSSKPVGMIAMGAKRLADRAAALGAGTTETAWPVILEARPLPGGQPHAPHKADPRRPIFSLFNKETGSIT